MSETGSWLRPGASTTATPLPDLTCKFAGPFWPVSEVFILRTIVRLDRQEVPTTARSPWLALTVYQPYQAAISEALPGAQKGSIRSQKVCICPMDVKDTKQTEHGFLGQGKA